jgi:hypothetical protein
MTITMVVMAVAMAVKTSMDAKRQAALSRKNAIAQQKVEQEALLKKRAEQGDAAAMAAFEKARAARVDSANIAAAKGEQGATTGNFQVDTMLQGLGFGTGLQTAADQRSSDAMLANTDMQLQSSGVNFTSKMRTINASDPSGLTTVMNAGMAGANAYAGSPGAFSAGGKGPTNTGGNRGIDVLGHT